MKQISFQQYRTIDLVLMSLILGLTQGAISIAATTVFADQLYVVSTVAGVTALVMMRWNGFAAIQAVLGGVLHVLLAGGQWEHYLIYGGGNLLSLLALVLFRLLGKEKIRKDVLLSLLFGLCVQVLMQLGRAGLAFALGFAPALCIRFITTDSLSILFTLVILWVVRRIEGLFEDQKNYLLRIQDKGEAERRDQF